MLAAVRRTKQRRTLLFLPSYFDFVRVRNWLTERDFDFVAVHEYSRTSGPPTASPPPPSPLLLPIPRAKPRVSGEVLGLQQCGR